MRVYSLLSLLFLLTRVATPALANIDSGDMIDVVRSKEYLEFSELEPHPGRRIRWGSQSGAFLYVSQSELPYIYLTGWIGKDEELQVNRRWIPNKNGYFEVKIPLRLEPNRVELRLYDKNRKFETYRLLVFWLKLPAGLRLKVREGEKVVEAGVSFSDQYRRSAFVQLYSGHTPITHVDIDAQKHSELSFRVYPPPDTDQLYDAWTFQLRNASDLVISEVRGKGMPPAYLDWREVSNAASRAGTFSYQMNLVQEGRVYEGARSVFHAVEGLSLMKRHRVRTIAIEPRQEIGFFTFSNLSNAKYSNSYVGGDVAAVFLDRFITRAQGLVSLHSVDPRSSLNFVRVGGGIRFFGDGDSAFWGKPFIYQMDLLLNYSGYNVGSGSSVQRFSSASALFEPQFVLWKYHYLVPWVEFGARPRMDFQRFSAGMNYYFFIRPWSVKVGLGISYDNLYRFDDDPRLPFKVFRAFGSFAFYL